MNTEWILYRQVLLHLFRVWATTVYCHMLRPTCSILVNETAIIPTTNFKWILHLHTTEHNQPWQLFQTESACMLHIAHGLDSSPNWYKSTIWQSLLHRPKNLPKADGSDIQGRSLGITQPLGSFGHLWKLRMITGWVHHSHLHLLFYVMVNITYHSH